MAVIFARPALIISLNSCSRSNICRVPNRLGDFIVATFTEWCSSSAGILPAPGILLWGVWGAAGWFGDIWGGIVGVFSASCQLDLVGIQRAWNAIVESVFGGLARLVQRYLERCEVGILVAWVSIGRAFRVP